LEDAASKPSGAAPARSMGPRHGHGLEGAPRGAGAAWREPGAAMETCGARDTGSVAWDTGSAAWEGGAERPVRHGN
jgi:hypothetical protein